MNRHLAHLLRRTARKLIAWSNRLDAPVKADRAVQYRGQMAGLAADALLETLVQDGKYASKGVARRRLGIADPPAREWKSWHDRLRDGIVPAWPSSGPR